MKKIFAVSILMFFLVSANAMALTYTFTDNVINWPGQTVTNPAATDDVYGTPWLDGMAVTIEDGYLTSVVINFAADNRVYWDSLFINTGGQGDNNWESWDYYVQSDSSVSGTLYSVAGNYTYSYATEIYQRTGHVNGFATGLTAIAGLNSLAYDGETLTYTFSGIAVGDNWTIGYTPDCANDVLLSSPVPEPATMMLLGLGLLGLAGISRKRR